MLHHRHSHHSPNPYSIFKLYLVFTSKSQNPRESKKSDRIQIEKLSNGCPQPSNLTSRPAKGKIARDAETPKSTGDSTRQLGRTFISLVF